MSASTRVAVYGLWHLGSVISACLASAGRATVGLDLDADVVANLGRGKPPLFEPGLTERIAAGLASGRLSFTTQPEEALRDAEVLWVSFDTPVDDRDEADVSYVRDRLETVADRIQPGTLVLVSSQVPVGFTGALERDWKGRGLRFACSPENLRLGKALDSFEHPERVVVGVRDESDKPLLASLFGPFCSRIEWMSIESAEMTKHAVNAFLATSVAFINELARLGEVLGADAEEVARGLKSEGRIGPRAYLSPGAAFAGGTLARDLRFLAGFGQRHRIATPLVDGVLASNDVHKQWLRDRLHEMLSTLDHPVVAVLGLTYKPGTSTLRRSSSLELCAWLHDQGVRVQAHDPAIGGTSEELPAAVHLYASPREALTGADVAVVATEWPDYRRLTAEDFLTSMRRSCIVDPNRFLSGQLGHQPRIVYVAPGLVRS
jgi:UDPglucose 6-dehydrogenase